MRYIYILVVFFFLSACVDQIDLDIDTDRSFVTIDGQIADELQEYEIRVSNSAVIGVGNDNILTPISGAIVEVVSDAGERIDFVEDIEDSGIYRQTMQGQVGSSYHVEISLSDGREIYSTPTEILPRVEIDSFSFNVTSESVLSGSGEIRTVERVNVLLNTTIADEDRPYLRWRAQGIYEFQEIYPMAFNPLRCYVSENIDINNLQVYDTNELNGTELFDQPVFSTDFNYRFHALYCAHIRQLRISEDEYDYWTAIDQLINIDGTLFDPPPASIQGNLYNVNDPADKVFGYFSVTSQSSRRYFIDVTDRGFIAESYCSPFSFRANADECSDCTLLNNSTLTKPEYWPY